MFFIKFPDMVATKEFAKQYPDKENIFVSNVKPIVIVKSTEDTKELNRIIKELNGKIKHSEKYSLLCAEP
jgi:hydrogenase maturation factor HypF (carbamoyltransferase family)